MGLTLGQYCFSLHPPFKPNASFLCLFPKTGIITDHVGLHVARWSHPQSLSVRVGGSVSSVSSMCIFGWHGGTARGCQINFNKMKEEGGGENEIDNNNYYACHQNTANVNCFVIGCFPTPPRLTQNPTNGQHWRTHISGDALFVLILTKNER